MLLVLDGCTPQSTQKVVTPPSTEPSTETKTETKQESSGLDRELDRLINESAVPYSERVRPPAINKGVRWGDVLPQHDPVRLGKYNPARDTRNFRETLDTRVDSAGFVGNIDMGAERRRLEAWAERLRAGRATDARDHLEFWMQTIAYTNYIESVNLTKGEARQLGEKAREEAVQTIKSKLKNWSNGEGWDPLDSLGYFGRIDDVCAALRLDEEDLEFTKSEILDLHEKGKVAYERRKANEARGKNSIK